jgi:hypothetical protein
METVGIGPGSNDVAWFCLFEKAKQRELQNNIAVEVTAV